MNEGIHLDLDTWIWGLMMIDKSLKAFTLALDTWADA